VSTLNVLRFDKKGLVHCGTVTHAAVDLDDILPCAGCDRNLLVYYHVSRRLGAHLGFMVDAEQLPEELAS
jgi:dimethylamine monooxygenase subunit C